jgi:hypothetical protein
MAEQVKIEKGAPEYPGKHNEFDSGMREVRNDLDSAPAANNGMPSRATQERNARDAGPGAYKSTYKLDK